MTDNQGGRFSKLPENLPSVFLDKVDGVRCSRTGSGVRWRIAHQFYITTFSQRSIEGHLRGGTAFGGTRFVRRTVHIDAGLIDTESGEYHGYE